MGHAYSATADGGVHAFPASGSFSPQMNSCLPARALLFMMGKGGAGEGNRTLVVSLGSFCSAIELHPLRSGLCRLYMRLSRKYGTKMMQQSFIRALFLIIDYEIAPPYNPPIKQSG